MAGDMHRAATSHSLRFLIYRRPDDYYLGARHTGHLLPTAALVTTDDPYEADFCLLPEDLRRLQVDLGRESVARFVTSLSHYAQFPEKHLLWSTHDDCRSPVPEALFCKASVAASEAGRILAVPYLVEDCGRLCHFEPSRFRWDTCFIGYPGSFPLRERLLLAVSADRRLAAHLDIAPKFHGHLDPELRAARRQRYLDALEDSLTALCPRGDGMNSIRFFETLSMGRIPVLIADGCLLPFASQIPYDRFVIRIAERDVDRAPRIICEWMERITPAEVLQRCREARNTWEQMLAPQSFMQPLLRELAGEHARRQGLHAYQRGHHADAESWFRHALQVLPDDPQAVRWLALLLHEEGRFEESITLLGTRLRSAVPVSGVHRLLGEAYQQTGRLSAARQQFSQALVEDPRNPELLVNLGTVNAALDRWDEALRVLAEAAALAPESAAAWMNLGCALQARHQMAEATAAFRRAVRLDPRHGTAAWNLAQNLLLRGEFSEGFALLEARFNKRDPVPSPNIDAPRWRGEPLAGKAVLVWTEQAFGDAIQFVRYIPMLAGLGARVLLYNHLRPLQRLLHSLPGMTALVDAEDSVPVVDYQVPLLSLPDLFRTTAATIPHDMVPYLAPDPALVMRWRRELSRETGVRIGLCWAGRPEPDPRRSATLADLAPLCRLTGVKFYSLQLGEAATQVLSPPQGMHLQDLTADIRDFEDTAAIMLQLDLVISVDTSVAHLAGALGRPVCVLLPFVPDWRWMLARQDCPWYPTMRLFRQQQPGDWAGAVDELLSFLLGAETPGGDQDDN
ncbi:tetratricopeptide repeat protein [Trichlorobacter ammonificans]|uniref:Exostosin GT47 domain-containing protein n=1 Tax=Trichlorobacter ammonificans TaxID=2916410 RepID=A0ABM9DBJ7_9BACT|nr:tetratricopeptide repeat protein [Trichlorobacter ammonificans]CAH2032607.1 protein of unknown function [Trichlorobacter ammonificans]